MAQLVFTPPRRLRLRLKPLGSARGSVDGAWWPRSRSLPDELPAIVRALGVRLARLERVSYRFLDWDRDVPTRLTVDGVPLHLDGYAFQTPSTIQFVGSGGVLVLAVVPPDSASEPAHEAMMAAAGRDNIQSAAALTAPVLAGSIAAGQQAAAEGSWDSEGGHADEGARRGHVARPSWT